MTDFRKARIPSGARGLPGRSFVSDEVFREEMERIFGRRWFCAGRAEEILRPGDYLAVQVGDESLLVVRGEDGAARAFYNVCRHRGTRLCAEPCGRLPGEIQCPYHGWTYGLDGQLLSARHMQAVEGFDRSDFPLVPAALAEWEGFLFLNLSREPEPFARAFAPVLDRFRAWGIASLRRARRIDYDVRANWKLVVENYSECYHCPLIHPALTRLSPPDSGRNDLLEGPFLGGYMTLREGVRGSMTTTGETTRPPLPGLPPEERDRVYYYALFPNLLLSLHPDYVMAHFLQPLEPRRTRILCDWYFDPAVMACPGFDPDDAVAFWDETNRQDWAICERTQPGVASRAYTPGPYAHAEGLLWAFDQEYRRAMEG